MTKPRKYHLGNLREKLLRHAFRLAEKEGVENLSLRSVSRAADVSHAAPYAHFKDKDAIVAAMKEITFRELYEALAAAAEKRSRPKDKLTDIATAYVRFL